MKSDETREGFARAVRTVATLNLGYFGIEFAVALAIGSVALFADSIDFLEDGAVNVLILIALARSPRTQARVGRLLAILLLAPTIATLWAAWSSYSTTSIPSPFALSITGLGALAVNLASAFLLVASVAARAAWRAAPFSPRATTLSRTSRSSSPAG